MDDLILNGLKQPFVIGGTRRVLPPELQDELPVGQRDVGEGHQILELLEEHRRYLSFVSKLSRERKREFGSVWQCAYCEQVPSRNSADNTCRPPVHFGI